MTEIEKIGSTPISRRSFIKNSAIGAAAVGISYGVFSQLKFGFLFTAEGQDTSFFLWDMSYKLDAQTRVYTVCPYCAGGCQVIVTVKEGKAIDMEGDPDCPINEGALCSKANGYLQLVNSPQRITKPMKRQATTKGETVDPNWDDTIAWSTVFAEIASAVVAAHNTVQMTHTDGGNTHYYRVGIDSPIAMHGSSYFNNEECYLSKKIISLLGSSENEHQARKCHASTVAGLGSTFGFGAMTNHFTDIANAHRILIIGSNAAENHPISFHHVQAAVENNDAKIIVLDPRYTRTASRADLFARFRSGTQAAIFMGFMRYLFEEEPDQIDWEFLYDRTNSPYIFSEIIEPTTADLDTNKIADAAALRTDALSDSGTSVLAQLRMRAKDYTAAEVSKITGIDATTWTEICDMYTQAKPGTIMYSMGTTQHTNGTYAIRAYAIVQLLLGNMGVPGGGVNALRGISNVQGSTDMNLLSHYVMGYRTFPRSVDDIRRYQKWKNTDQGTGKTIEDKGGVTGGATYTPANKTEERWDGRHFPTWNSLEYNWGIFIGTYPGTDPDTEDAICDLPVGIGNPTIQLFRKMHDGDYDVVLIFGENNAVSNANSSYIREALADSTTKVVVFENFDHETAHFADYLLPATFPTERYGTITNSGRWVQWRTKAVDPPGDNMPEVEFLSKLFYHIRQAGLQLPSEKYMEDNALTGNELNVKIDDCWPTIYKPYAGTETIDNTWLKETAAYTYREMGADVLDATVNTSRGRKTVQPAANVLHKKSWNSSGASLIHDTDPKVLGSRRDRTQNTQEDKDYGYWKQWAWSWMLNQRVLYNPDEAEPGLATFFNWWASTDEVWLGLDKASIWSRPRFNRTAAETRFGATDKEKHPLYWGVPLHNEPVETPVAAMQTKYPTVWYDEKFTDKGYDPVVKGSASTYPYVLTTFRLTEHMQAGAMTRNVPWLIQCHPECFLEISEELAAEKGIQSGDLVDVESARAKVRVKASVTKRLKPFTIDGDKTVHEVAMPWHWGFKGLSTGPTANDVTMDAVDYHANIPETKACLVKITKV